MAKNKFAMITDTKINIGEKSKSQLIEFASKIDLRLNKFWDDEIAKGFGFGRRQKNLVKQILLHSSEHNLRSAKRLRASFVYYGYKLNNHDDPESIWNAAIAIELVHTALLMHDDFMDQDKLRRGKPTTHEYFANGDQHYGGSMAVNIGDNVLCLGYETLLNCGQRSERVHPALSQLLRGIANTAFGQAFDVWLQKSKDWNGGDVIDLHKAKTAIYTYENPLFIGAHLGGLDPQIFPILHQYSFDGGIAFQLQDDILGVFGDEEKTGKSANSDLIQGKCTLIINKALENGTPSQVAAIQKVWGNQQATEKELQEAKKAIVDSGSYEYNKNLARTYASKAAEHASQLNSYQLNKEAVDYIQGIAEYMVNRDV